MDSEASEAVVLPSSSLILDQDAAMALLKEINADLATGRIRQKMAVSRVAMDSRPSEGEGGRARRLQTMTALFAMSSKLSRRRPEQQEAINEAGGGGILLPFFTYCAGRIDPGGARRRKHRPTHNPIDLTLLDETMASNFFFSFLRNLIR